MTSFPGYRRELGQAKYIPLIKNDQLLIKKDKIMSPHIHKQINLHIHENKTPQKNEALPQKSNT